MVRRHTKIVATLGPATDPPGVIDQLAAAGLDCARLNCSHGTGEDLRRRARAVREAAQRAERPIALMFDLQGPKLRLSADTEQRAVEVGLEFLSARRALNLSSMRLLEESLRATAAAQRAAGGAWRPLARVSSAQAGVVHAVADMYRVTTGHLAR